jgi:hypothetical protein
MDEVHRPQDRISVGPTRTTYRLEWLVLLGLLAAILWSFAVWTAYVTTGLWPGHITVPMARRLVTGFNMHINPVSRVVLEYGGWALPVLACLGLLLVWWPRSRWAWRFVLLGLPLLAGAALYFISDHCVSRLREGLSR